MQSAFACKNSCRIWTSMGPPKGWVPCSASSHLIAKKSVCTLMHCAYLCRHSSSCRSLGYVSLWSRRQVMHFKRWVFANARVATNELLDSTLEIAAGKQSKLLHQIACDVRFSAIAMLGPTFADHSTLQGHLWPWGLNLLHSMQLALAHLQWRMKVHCLITEWPDYQKFVFSIYMYMI